MTLTGRFLPVKCAECDVELIRVEQPASNDFIICTGCRGVGSYKKVVLFGNKLIGGALTERQMAGVLTSLDL